MRGNMDPLAPTTHTLGPAIAHIAETATSLSSSMQCLQKPPEGLGISVTIEEDDAEKNAEADKQKQRDTVKWVLDTPRRLQDLIEQEQEEEAERDWEVVSNILTRWKNVAGVADLRKECEYIMREVDDSE